MEVLRCYVMNNSLDFSFIKLHSREVPPLVFHDMYTMSLEIGFDSLRNALESDSCMWCPFLQLSCREMLMKDSMASRRWRAFQYLKDDFGLKVRADVKAGSK
jgi:hypothetical protein